jgi:hypothetical protein
VGGGRGQSRQSSAAADDLKETARNNVDCIHLAQVGNSGASLRTR